MEDLNQKIIESYWIKKLSGELTGISLPKETGKKEEKEGRQVTQSLPFEIPTHVVSKLFISSKGSDIALFILFLTVLNIVLKKYTEIDDLVVGTLPPTQNRVNNNIIFCRNRVLDDWSIRELISQVKQVVLEAINYSEYPVDKICEALQEKHRTDLSTLFNIAAVFEPFQVKCDFLNRFDLVLTLSASDQKMFLLVGYTSSVYSNETIERFCRNMIISIERMLDDPGKKISQLNILSDYEINQLLYEFNNTAAEYPKDKTIHQLFEEQVEKTPDYISVVNQFLQITYYELNKKSNRLALALMNNGVIPDTIVSIKMERSIEMIIGIFGILKAGGAYLPIDPNYPPNRISYILKDSNSILLLTQEKYSNVADVGCIVQNFDEIGFKGSPGEEFKPVEPKQPSNTIVYVIYTSGSTGFPKGVMIEHHSVINRLTWMQKRYPLNHRDIILQKTTYIFDVSVWELFWWSFLGASLYLLNPGGEKNPQDILAAIEKKNISTLHFVPSMLNVFLEYVRDMDSLKGKLCLKYVFSSGEALAIHHVEKFREYVFKRSKAVLINLYGPTEATVDVSYFDCPHRESINIVPIGKPIDNTGFFVVDKNVSLQPVGVPGELCLSGVGLARGYLNKCDLTHEKFIHNPFIKDLGMDYLYKRLYRTGDLVRWILDGNIEFLGRIDQQVKIRGFRIELGEIESLLLKYKEIKDVVVLATDTDGEKQLCAYMVSDKELTIKELKADLSIHLPEYMIPLHFYQIEKIPLTLNGKLDRNALGLYSNQLKTGFKYVAPENSIQEKIIDIWKQVLKRDNIGIHDNYFDLGGTSFDILKINKSLKDTFQLEIPIPVMFRYTTVDSLEKYLRNQSGEAPYRAEARPFLEGRCLNKEEKRRTEVAVIGMAGKFPGAKDLDEFWENIQHGKEMITFFSDNELRENEISDKQLNDPNYVKAAGIIEDIECFDAPFFGYTPKEAEIMDPQIRFFHECVWNALEDAGYDPIEYEGLIGLYAGASPNTQWHARVILSEKYRDIGGFASNQLINKGFLTLRISYKLNLRGPSFELNTACSTSLVAIHTGCMAVLNGECGLALAGGVTISHLGKSGYLYQEGMILSPDGHCRAFDSNAKGTVASDGGGVIVLKRLENAILDRDNIYAVIKGTSINNDGIRKAGFTAPGVDGQVAVIRMALQMAEVPPESINYIETHGTGTELGDPVEIEALKLAFNTGKKSFCALGSVKSNIGHTDAAAGVAGILKTILTLKYKCIPPSLYFEIPNPNIDLINTPFYINSTLSDWRKGEYPRRAGVSSFGIGGTNAHAILEEWSIEKANKVEDDSRNLLLFSAKTQSSLDQMTENLAEFFKKNIDIDLGDVTYTLQTGRQAFKYKKMAICSTTSEAIEFLSSQSERKVHSFVSDNENRQVIFMFSGLGAQYKNMGLDLYRTEPVFRDEMNRCFKILESVSDINLKEILYPEDEVFVESNRINQPEIVQPLIFIFEFALAHLLIKWGIKPNAMIGYSFGEYIAACIAGVFSLEDAIKLVVYRGKLIKNTPSGAMLSVPLSREDLMPLINDRLSISIDNGSSCVLGGLSEDINGFEKKMREKKVFCVRLQTSYAIHSQTMIPILHELESFISGIKLNKPKISYISNVTGTWINDTDATNPVYWSRHLRETVQFYNGIGVLIKKQNSIFIEIGPGRDLSALVLRLIDSSPGQKVLNIIRHSQKKISDMSFLLEKIGWLWLWGVKINWNSFHSGQERRRISLPTYPFERLRYWIPSGSIEKIAIEKPGNCIPDISDWFYFPTWKRLPLEVSKCENTSSCRYWLIFLNEEPLGNLLVNRIKEMSRDVIIVKVDNSFKQLNKNQYTLNPKEYQNFDKLAEKLYIYGQLPERIIHLWNIPGEEGCYDDFYTGSISFEKAQRLGFFSLLYIARAFGKQKFSHTIFIHVLTSCVQDVYGGESINVGQSPLIGLLKVIPQEYPGIRCNNIDIKIPKHETLEEEVLVKLLLKEFLICPEEIEPDIAFRNNQRWVQFFDPIHLEIPSMKQSMSRIRQNGVFLITGGVGNIGFMFAELFVKQFGARLILTGRSSFPENGESINKLKKLEEMGGEVIYIQADVADIEQMRAVVIESKKRFGEINGIIHAAGITEGQSIRIIGDLTDDDCYLQFRSKVIGGLVLAELFKDKELDFCWVLSSISCVLGGVGFGAYASANRFLDSFVKKHNRLTEGKSRWFCLNWDGMDSSNSIDIFKRFLVLTDIDQLIVSRGGNIHKRIDNWIKFKQETLKENLKEKSDGRTVSHSRPNLSNNYVAPMTEIDKAIAKIWENLFGFESIGIDDDFFELGGDSLKANTLLARIHCEFGVNIPLTEFFQNPTIGDSAKYISTSALKKNNIFYSIKPVEEKEYYLLSSVQKRMYVVQQMQVESKSYNIPSIVELEGEINYVQFDDTFLRLLTRHEALRTSFEIRDGKPSQVINKTIKTVIEHYEIDEENAQIIIESFMRPFDLSRAPLMRVGLIKTMKDRHILMVDMHHIISDGVSYNILVEEFFHLYSGGNLLPLKIQYKDFAEWQNKLVESGEMKRQKEYWLSIFRKGDIPILNMLPDYPRPPIRNIDAGDHLNFTLDEMLCRGIHVLMDKSRATLSMILTSVFSLLLFLYTHQEDIVIGIVITGRTHADLEKMIGVFVNTLPLRTRPQKDMKFIEFLDEVKKNSLRAYENQDYPFDELVLDLGLQGETGRTPLFDVAFNLNNIENTETKETDLKIKPYKGREEFAKLDLTLYASEARGQIYLTFRYSTQLFNRSTIERLLNHYNLILEQITNNFEIKLKDIVIAHDFLIPNPLINPDVNDDDDFDL